jgi:hypothetical protein
MRHRNLAYTLAIALAASAGVAGCTSTQTSTEIAAPSSQKCQVQVSNSPSTFPDAGGSGTLQVGATRDCGWSAATTANWVSMANTSGQGDATISYSVAANSVPQVRSAAITVEGQTVQLTQAAAPCRYALSKNVDTAASSGGPLSVAVTTLTGCGWTTSSDSGWLVISSNASGNASATVGLTVAPNGGGQRTGHALIAGQTYTVTQEAASASPPPPSSPAPSPSPTPAPAPAPTPSPPAPPVPLPARVDGKITAVSGKCPGLGFTVAGKSIVASASTVYRGGKCGDLKVGVDVDVDGTTESNGTISATAIGIE